MSSSMSPSAAASTAQLKIFKLLLQYGNNPEVIQEAEESIEGYKRSLKSAGVYREYIEALRDHAHVARGLDADAARESSSNKRMKLHPDDAGGS